MPKNLGKPFFSFVFTHLVVLIYVRLVMPMLNHAMAHYSIIYTYFARRIYPSALIQMV